jgi:exopolysaccharide biosynthesis WecB/TagA/CpsF family protein
MDSRRLFGIRYKVTNYDESINIIIKYATERKSFGVSALAVHGLIEAYRNSSIKTYINKIDWVVPDGQPIRWALNSFYKVGLKDRVYGPALTLKVLEKANTFGFRIYLYGSSSNTVEKFAHFIEKTFPKITICGIHVDRFREATKEEDKEDIKKINDSEPHIVLVGRGCPRQEIWVANHLGKIHAPMMAVGAAFDFHAGTVKQAPKWMQDNGLEWFFRLIQEPRRLWKRYLITNSYFIYLFAKFKVLKLNH